MSKEKKRSNDESKTEQTTFYHEIIGVISIVLSIIILGKLGKLGEWFTIFTKVLFGDCYWFLVIFIFIYGTYNLIMHKSFDFKHQRFIGYIFIALGILVFAHFRLHSIVQKRGGNFFKTTWTIYINYISNPSDIYLGGGIVGSLIFYIFYYLFGVIGVVLIASILLVMGMSLLINKTLVEITESVTKRLKFLGKYTRNFNKFFKYEMGIKKEKVLEKHSIFGKNIKLPLKVLEEYQNLMNLGFQEKVSYDIKSLITSVFNNLNIEYKELKMDISYSFTRYEYLFFTKIDHLVVRERLKNVLDEKIIYHLVNYNTVVIEINNRHFQILAIRNLLMMQESLYNNYIIPIGINSEKRIVEVDINKSGHLLLVGSSNSGVTNFVRSFVVALFVKQNLSNYEIKIIDNSEDFKAFNDIIEILSGDLNQIFTTIIDELEERINILSKNSVNTIEEYNRKIEVNNLDLEMLMKKFYIINKYTDEESNYNHFENKLMYIAQLGVKCGINIVYIVREERYVTTIINSIFQDKLVFRTDTDSFSQSVLNNNYATFLTGRGDCYYLNKAESIRIQTALTNNIDFNNVIKYLLK